jgi:cyanophycinase
VNTGGAAPGAPGPLALVGGGEFQPGNEAQDRVLIAAAGDGPAYVLPTAAARQDPARAVANAVRWFADLGRPLEELPVLTRAQADDPALAERAGLGRLFYLVGGDPGHLLATLADSALWRAMRDAWRGGAALAGSSAGAMVLGEHVLLRERWPDTARRRTTPGLGLVPGVAVVPHYGGGGGRWRLESDGQPTLLGLDERTAALWRAGDGWRAHGPGSVTVVGRGSFGPGEPILGLRDPW